MYSHSSGDPAVKLLDDCFSVSLTDYFKQRFEEQPGDRLSCDRVVIICEACGVDMCRYCLPRSALFCYLEEAGTYPRPSPRTVIPSTTLTGLRSGPAVGRLRSFGLVRTDVNSAGGPTVR